MLGHHSKSQNASVNEHHAAKKIRLVDRHTGEFLHLTGEWKTGNVEHSWLGTIEQARKLRAKWIAQNDNQNWPFIGVRRSDLGKKRDG